MNEEEDRQDDDGTSLLLSSSVHALVQGDPYYPAPKIPGCIAARHSLAILGFIGFFNVYMMRVNLSVAIVAMANNTHEELVHYGECPGENVTAPNFAKTSAQTFDWDEDIQNQILSSFFYGYIFTQIPGGWLAGRYGGKWLFGLGILITSVLTLLTPLAASVGLGWFIAVRIIEGMAEGLTYPSIFAMIACWAPPLERTKLTNIITSGSAVGTIVALPVAGAICNSELLKGWPSVFYLSDKYNGSLGVLWFFFWCFLSYDSPAKHPRISKEEKEYIERSIGTAKVTTLHLPLVPILTSGPVWAIIINNFTYSWGLYTLLTNLPNFLKNVLKFDISQSGYLSAIPFICLFLVTVLGGFAADSMRRSGILSTVLTRKFFNSIGLLLSGISLVMVGYVDCDAILAVIFLCICQIGAGLVQQGHAVNQLDIAPKYAGVLMGLSNTFGTAAGFLAPTTVGLLTEGNNTVGQWLIIFWISFGFLILGCLVFILLGAGEVQVWALEGYSPQIVKDYDTTSVGEQHSINPDMAPSIR